MGDCERRDGTVDGDCHLILSVYHSVKALQASRNLSPEMERIISELGDELSRMTGLEEGEADNDREIVDRLTCAQGTITRLHSDHAVIWNSGASVMLEYLKAVDEVRMLTEALESLSRMRNSKKKEIVDRGQTILQIAMVRLQEELIHILAQNKQCFEYASVPVCEEDSLCEESVVSYEDNSVDIVSQRVSCSTETDEYLMYLVHPDVIPQIMSIAKIMFASQYSQEFCLAFVNFWRHAIDDHLSIFRVGQFSIADVLKMDWGCLNSKIKKWCRAIKNVISVYLSSAKRLFDQILGEYGCTSSVCLVEASTASVLRLLDFGQAVALGPHGPQWLYCLVEMYEVLVPLIPDIEVLYPGEVGSMIKMEFNELFMRLGTSVKFVFTGFSYHIESSSSTNLYLNAGVQHLTKYVMNYIDLFTGYRDTVDSLFEDRNVVNDHLRRFASLLEANLEKKSNVYVDLALKHLFLMNNIHYMVEKIRNSNIRSVFGDEWIRSHICVYQKHAKSYERATWSTVLTLLQGDGKTGKAALKLRCHSFAAAFEDIYKIQTGWPVPDLKLREELRISASKNIIQAYRHFINNIANSISDKNIKFSEQDLETYIFDLLEGSSKLLNPSPKR